MRQVNVTVLMLVLTAVAPLVAQSRACSLVTSAEVTKATGLSFRNPPTETTVAGQTNCTYTSGGNERFVISMRENGGKGFYERSKALQHECCQLPSGRTPEAIHPDV